MTRTSITRATFAMRGRNDAEPTCADCGSKPVDFGLLCARCRKELGPPPDAREPITRKDPS